MKTLTIASFFLSSILYAANSINTPMVIPAVGNVTVLAPNSDKELAWVDEQIQAILPARIGIAESSINTLVDPIKHTVATRSNNPPPPFLNAPKMTLLAPPKLGSLPSIALPIAPKVVEEPLRLQALMNNSALINGKWYRPNSLVRDYTLAEIKSSSVLLNGKKGQPLILFLNRTNTNIKINTK